MAEEHYECTKCGVRFEADAGEVDLSCSECGSDEIERFVDVLYARDREFVQELAETARRSEKGAGKPKEEKM